MILNQNFVANPQNLFQNFAQFNNQGKPNFMVGFPKITLEDTLADMNTKDTLHESTMFSNVINQKIFTTKKQTKVQKIEKSYFCSHKNCSKNPKTKKQKINHHDKIDKECRNEKKLIFKLLIDFVDSTKQLINYCYPRSKDNSKEIMKNPKMILFVQKIQTQFAQTKKRTIDKEQFNALVNPLNLAPNDK